MVLIRFCVLHGLWEPMPPKRHIVQNMKTILGLKNFAFSILAGVVVKMVKRVL